MAIRIEASRPVQAPRAKVWSIISNMDSEPKFWRGIAAVRVLERKEGFIRRVVTLTFRGRESEEEVHLTPGQSILHRIVGGPLRGTKVVELLERNGETVLRAAWDIRLTGLLKFGSGFIRRHIAEGTEKALDRIKAEAEGRMWGEEAMEEGPAGQGP
jgi:carbon monoxide dehydrogenase subunit G